jgi:UDP-N-acetylmuramate: L-alanyl-gamma-D-glutamyl-meso-diaminopimelate ligase
MAPTSWRCGRTSSSIGNVVSRARLADGTPRYPLMEAILDAGVPYTSGPQWLAEQVLAGRHVLAVAGTHGKTTTTAMLAWILEQQGLQPGFLIGGVPLNFGVSARLSAPPAPGVPGRPGVGDCFVIEADEYDTAFFDKRSKFVHYRPRTAILNNLEFDHADIFDDLAAIERQFHHLLRTVPGTGAHGSGRVIVNGLEESLARVLHAGCWSEQRSFGAAVSDYTAQGEPHAFDVLLPGSPGRSGPLVPQRRAQPAQCAGGDRGGRACGRRPADAAQGACRLPERAPPHGGARAGCNCPAIAARR